MKKQTDSGYIQWIFLALPVLWMGAVLAYAYEDGMNVFELLPRFAAAMEHPFAIGWTAHTPRFVLGALVAYGFAVTMYLTGRQNRRPGEEHGSAHWGNVHQLDRKYRDKDLHNNVILSQNLHMSLNGRKHFRNLLQIVVGGSGSGKTRYVVKPNIYEANASYIATDPKGELARAAVPLLLREGYVIRVIDLVDLDHSDHYNPFHYIRSDADVLKLIANFIRNTTPKGAHSNDPFWEKSEIALDSALMLYLLHEAPPEEQTMEMMLTMLEYGAAKEGDGDYQSPLDLLFEALEEENPNHIALRQYKVFKQAPSETAMSILITASVRLAPFTLPEVQRITSKDTMELDKLGERKQAVFCIIPDSNDASLNFLVGMLYTQAFQELYYQADKVHGGALPVPVRLMFDEFANVALPDGYARLQATMRSRNIMATIILQNISQLKALFKDDWEGIIGNADSFIYLGGNEQSTHKYVSELLGKETIQTQTSSQSKGRNGSYSQNFQQAGRELLTPDEVRMLDNRLSIVLIRGEAPVMDAKSIWNGTPTSSTPGTAGPPPTSTTPSASMTRAIWTLNLHPWTKPKSSTNWRNLTMKNDRNHSHDLIRSRAKARRCMAAWTALVLSLALFTLPAFAAAGGGSDPLSIVNNLSDFIFSCIKAIGVIILGWGIVQLGMSIQSHDASQRSQGMLCVFGGLIIAFSKEILSTIGAL